MSRIHDALKKAAKEKTSQVLAVERADVHTNGSDISAFHGQHLRRFFLCSLFQGIVNPAHRVLGVAFLVLLLISFFRSSSDRSRQRAACRSFRCRPVPTSESSLEPVISGRVPHLFPCA